MLRDSQNLEYRKKLAITAAEIRSTILRKYDSPVSRVGFGLNKLFVFTAGKSQLLSTLAGVKARPITALKPTSLW
jgi:hypothetical protein